jgi:hypothetical protein
MRSLTIIFCLVLALFSFQQAQARIIHVPADSSTIQGGINGAVNGDTVLVAPGTYYEHINFRGKAILVASEAGAESTIISKAGNGIEIVKFVSGEDTSSVLDGFTVQNAYSQFGAIKIYDASATIRNCIIRGNHGYVGYNWATGGISCTNSPSIIENNIVYGNSSSGVGGGIGCFRSAFTRIRNNVVYGNSASYLGGGIVCFEASHISILDNTIVGNVQQSGLGGGVACYACDNIIVTNNILTDNNAWGVYFQEVPLVQPEVEITYNDAWNNVTGNYLGVTPGEGCITADPIFCNPSDTNFYLYYASPCLGAGQDSSDIGALGLGCLLGDVNTDGQINSADVVYLINYLFIGGPPPTPLVAGDVNCDGKINVVDVVYLINYLFIGGPPPCEP